MSSDPTVFLGGPILHCTKADGTFDPAFKRFLQTLIKTLEVGGFNVRSAHRFERFGQLDTAGQEVAVCRRDFAWMNSNDIFACVLPSGLAGASVRSDGTCIELGWASALGKPILMVIEESDTHSHLVKGLGGVADVTVLNIRVVHEQPNLFAVAARRIWERIYGKEQVSGAFGLTTPVREPPRGLTSSM